MLANESQVRGFESLFFRGIQFYIILLIGLVKGNHPNKHNELDITRVIQFLINDNLKENGGKQQTLIQQGQNDENVIVDHRYFVDFDSGVLHLF